MNIEKPRAGLGASSILLIIVILCLTAFGTLTFMTAQVDLNLTEETIEAQRTYYEADAAAQTAIAALDSALAKGEAPPSGWVAADGVLTQTFPIRDSMVLAVTVEDAGGMCRIVRYCTRNDAAWESATQWGLW